MTDLPMPASRADRRTASVTSRLRTSRTIAPALVGLLGLAISLAGIGVPSIWYDEAATISAATRTWPQLWEMVGNVDAVHAVFYALMHVVFDLFGYSPIALRAPSAVAVGIAGALTVVLARQFTGTGTALVAGIVFCFLPRVSWMGTEGRSYALTAALSVLLTIVLVRAQRSSSRRWWVLYGAVAVVSCLVFVYLALIVVAHGFTMAWWLAAGRKSAIPAVRRWLVASGAAALLLLPFALRVTEQTGQIKWIEPLGSETFLQVFRTQWFLYSDVFAIAAWILVAFGALALLRPSRGFSLAAVILPGMIIPTVALLVATEVYTPLYSPRYVTMCVPFVAILIGSAIGALPARSLLVLTLASVMVLGVPSIVEERLPEAKQQSTWKQVAELIGSERAQSGDDSTAIIYGPVRYHPTATSRVIAYSYPQPFEGTIDVTLGTPAAETGELWETRGKLAESIDRLDDADVAYLITSIKRDRRAATSDVMTSLGWHLTNSWNLVDVNVLRYDR